MARLRQFFDAYADALSKADIEGMARAYAEQFMTAGPNARASMNNDQNFRAALAESVALYKQIGVDVVEVKNYLEAELGSGFWLTKIEWELLDEDLNTIVVFDNTYIVKGEIIEGEDNTPRLLLSIAHNEHQRMQEKGLLPGKNKDR
jgi:hypothetical protein